MPEILPPKLLPNVSGALFKLGAKKTLVNFLCTNRRTYEFCIPSLMRSVELSAANGFDAAKAAAFAVDALGTGKWALVKSLQLEASIDWTNDHGTIPLICVGLTNVERLICAGDVPNGEEKDTFLSYFPAMFLWNLLNLRPTAELREIAFSTIDLKPVQVDSTGSSFLKASGASQST